VKHKYWGTMEDGAAVFISDDGGLLLEDGPGDLTRLMPDRRAAVFEKWPVLLSLCRSRSTLLPGAVKVSAVAYKVVIADQEAWIETNRGTVAALKAANAERGATINELLAQISDLNDRVLTLHATNRKWKELVEIREEGIVDLLAECATLRKAAGKNS